MLTLYNAPKSMIDFCNTYIKKHVDFDIKESEGMTYNIRFYAYANINVVSGNDKEVFLRVTFKDNHGFTIKNTEFDKMEIE